MQQNARGIQGASGQHNVAAAEYSILNRVFGIIRRDIQQAADTASSRCRSVAVLQSLVDRQYIIPTPTWITLGFPLVEIVGRTAHVDRRVEGARSPEHPTSGPVQPTLEGALLRSGEVSPVVRAQPQLALAAFRFSPTAPVRQTRA